MDPIETEDPDPDESDEESSGTLKFIVILILILILLTLIYHFVKLSKCLFVRFITRMSQPTAQEVIEVPNTDETSVATAGSSVSLKKKSKIIITNK